MNGWEHYLGEADRAVIAKARFGRRMGFGERLAVVVIDAQRYMVGEPGRDDAWPSSCGEVGRAAVAQIARIVGAAQAASVPCFFTRFELARDGSDIGVYGRKRDLLDSSRSSCPARATWCS